MYDMTEKFSAAILGNQRTFRARIRIDGAEVVAEIRSIRQCQMACAGSYITVGGAVASYVDIEMQAPEISLDGKEIEVSIGLLADDDTVIGWCPIGLYTVQKPANSDGVLTFTAYDRIQSKMTGAYFSKLAYPADGKAMLREISAMTGVPIDVADLPDGVMVQKRAVISEQGVDEDGNEITNTTYEEPLNGYTYREALGYLAMLYGKFAVTDRTGNVVFRWYAGVDYKVIADRCYDDLTTDETVFTVGAISCAVGDKTLVSGTGLPNVQLENPLMTQARLDAIRNQIKDFQFLPAGVSFLGDMRVDVGDIITVYDKRGNLIKIPLMSITQEFDGGLLTRIRSYGGAQEENAAKGPTLQRLDRAYTELFLVKELVGSKASFDYVYGKVGEFDELKVKQADFETLTANRLQATGAAIGELNAKSITTDNLSAKVAELGYLSADSADLKYATISSLNATDAKITSLTAKVITTDNLSAKVADLGYATIDNLNAATARIGVLEVETLKADELEYEVAKFGYAKADQLDAANAAITNLSGRLSSFETSVSQELIAAKGWMAEGSIGSAQISDLDANKIKTGTLNTALVDIAGSDGRLQISDNTIQIKDANRVRVQVGKDASGDYTLAVWDKTGKLIWDALGATEHTIQRKIIRDKMVADDAAIQALKIDFQSFETALTDQGIKISGTVVQVGSKTLNVALSEQTQTITDNYTSLKNYTDSAKSAAISTAASDATTKANSALASAKSYADAGIAGIEIGGRNLDANTAPTSVTGWSAIPGWALSLVDCTAAPYGKAIRATNGTATSGGVYKIPIGHTKMVNGGKYTVSAWVRASKSCTINFRNEMMGSNTISVTTGWKRYVFTSTINTATQYRANVFYVTSGIANGMWIEVHSLMLESGAKASDWSPAPEDFYAEIDLTNATVATHTETLSSHDTRITANENAIKLKVSTQDFNSYKTTVTGAISTAKTEAINTAASDATTKANNAKSAAISTAASDVKTKADKALTDAKTYTNAQITTVNQSLSTTNQEINVLKGQIALKVEQTDIDTAVSSIEIGGRNLIVSSEIVRNVWITSAGAESASGVCMSTGFISVQPGESIILQYWQPPNSNAGDKRAWTGTLLYFDSGKKYKSGYKSTYFADIHKVIQKTVPDGCYYIRATYQFPQPMPVTPTNWNIGSVLKWKIEKGNKATDWSPAPEDTDAAIEAVDAKFASYSTTTQMQSAINLAKTSITQSVSETYATKSQVSTVSGNVSSLTTRLSVAESKLTKDSLVTTIGSYYATQTYADNAKSAAISTAASDATTKANNALASAKSYADAIEIGGTNLISGTREMSAYYKSSNVTLSTDAEGFAVASFAAVSTLSWNTVNALPPIQFSAVRGKTVTVSLWVRSDDYAAINAETSRGLLIVAALCTGTSATRTLYANIKNAYAMTLSSSWQKVTGTVTLSDSFFKNGSGTIDSSTRFYVQVYNYSLYRMQIKKIKLEIGNKATDWSPALEDTDSAIESVKTIATQTANKFNWIVKSGTCATDFTLTDRTATLIANAINLKGLVTFSGLDSETQNKITTAQSTADAADLKAEIAKLSAHTADLNAAIVDKKISKWAHENDATLIDGAKIYTGSITAQQIDVVNLFAQDIAATGTIRGAKLISGSEDATRSTQVYKSRITFYKGSTKTGVIQPIAWGNDYENSEGVMFGTNSKYLAIGYYGTNGYSAGYILNNGLNPNGYTERNLIYEDARFVNNVYFGSGSVRLGSMSGGAGLYLGGGYLSTSGKIMVGNVRHGDFMLDVTGNAYIEESLHVGGCILTGNPGGLQMITTTGNSRQIDIANSLNKGRLVCSAAGNFGLYDAKYEKWLIRCEQNGTIVSNATSSDKRLKANIAPSTINALSVINQIQMRQFDWIKEGVHQKIGVVADELETIDPYLAVGGGYDADGINIKCVRDFYLLGYAIKGIQEICEIDQAQNSTLVEHEGRINTIASRQESLQEQLGAALARVAQQAAEIAQLRARLRETA